VTPSSNPWRRRLLAERCSAYLNGEDVPTIVNRHLLELGQPG